jgi:hypothetical protein
MKLATLRTLFHQLQNTCHPDGYAQWTSDGEDAVFYSMETGRIYAYVWHDGRGRVPFRSCCIPAARASDYRHGKGACYFGPRLSSYHRKLATG